MKRSYIYILIDPTNNHIRYVGQSVKPKKRFYDHLSCSKNNNINYDHVHSWIKKLLSQDLRPIFKIIDDADIDNIDELERFYIKYYSNQYKLTNILSGGQSRFEYSEEQLKRMQQISTKIRTIYGINLKTKIAIKYNSTIEICIQLGFTKKGVNDRIVECCNNKRKIVKGFIFVWGDEFKTKTINQIINHRKNQQYKSILKYNKDGKFIKEYKSRGEAARSINGIADVLTLCCNQTPKYLTYKGFQWRWKITNNFPKKIKPVKRKIDIRSVSQIDLDDKPIKKFISIRQASKTTGIGYDGIIACCNNRSKTSGGYKWKYN